MALSEDTPQRHSSKNVTPLTRVSFVVEVNKENEHILESCYQGDSDDELESEIKEAFAAYDQDGDGYIKADDFRVALYKIGLEPKNEELNEMIRMADCDRDGKITYQDFRRMMLTSRPTSVATHSEAQNAYTITPQNSNLSRKSTPSS